MSMIISRHSFGSDRTEMAMIQIGDELGKVLHFTVELHGELITVLTKYGKETLSILAPKLYSADITLPMDIHMSMGDSGTMKVLSDVCDIQAHNLILPEGDEYGKYLTDVCRLIIGDMLLNQLHETKDVPNDINGHAYQLIMKDTNASGNGMLLFGVVPVRVQNIQPIQEVDIEIADILPIPTMKKASRVCSEARKLLVGMLERNNISTEQVAEDFMCSDIIAEAILEGKVELSLEKFLILCKITGVESKDVLNAVSLNLANVKLETV